MFAPSSPSTREVIGRKWPISSLMGLIYFGPTSSCLRGRITRSSPPATPRHTASNPRQIELFRHGRRNKRNEIEQTKAYLRERFDRALEQQQQCRPPGPAVGVALRWDGVLSNVEVVCRWRGGKIALVLLLPNDHLQGNEICGEIERYMLGILFALFYLYSNFINLFCKLRVCVLMGGGEGEVSITECGLLVPQESGNRWLRRRKYIYLAGRVICENVSVGVRGYK